MFLVTFDFEHISILRKGVIQEVFMSVNLVKLTIKRFSM